MLDVVGIMVDFCFFRSFLVFVVFVVVFKLLIFFGEFIMYGFFDEESGKEYVVLSMGDIVDGVLVFGCLYFECLIGDVLFSLCCDCGF